LTKELTLEKKTVKDNQKILEEEILQRVIIENKNQSMMDNFKFKDVELMLNILLYILFCIKHLCSS